MNADHKLTVSVMMCVYNSERTIGEAIESVLGQTFGDFELVIVNDGSTDGSGNIIESYNDSRIRIFHRQKRVGITKVRRFGLEKARGEYIAILDSDDIALPVRLQKQVDFLDNNPDINLVGSWIEGIDKAGKKTGIRKDATDPLIIKWILGFDNCIANSSSLYRRDVALEIGAYLFDGNAIEDYETLLKFNSVGGIGCVPEVLVCIREHQHRLSKTEPFENKLPVLRSLQRYLAAFLGKDVELDVCKCLFLRNHFITDNKILLIKSVEFLLEYTERFLKQYRLSSTQISEIREILATYLMDIARLYARGLPSASLRIIVKSLKQDLGGCFSTLFMKSTVKSLLGLLTKGPGR